LVMLAEEEAAFEAGWEWAAFRACLCVLQVS